MTSWMRSAWSPGACLLVAVFGCSSPESSPGTAEGGVRSVTVGIHTNCPYGLVA